MLGEDVLYLSLRELAQKIRTRAISPVELTESYLERSRRFSRLNGYATLTPDLALAQARRAEQEIQAGKYRGPLHGIPYAAKDLLAVKGYPTTWGAKPYAKQQFSVDANVIRRLEAAGAILLGKAAMIELAGGMGYRFGSASVSGPAHNPWKEDCWTCGSSSGSGAIVAAGLAAFAIGTETWGSIVCPSGYCGLSGLRPTFGRVGRSGAMALSYSMDKIGTMCRTADDCGLVLAVIAAHDPDDIGSLPQEKAAFSYNEPAHSARPLRVGWVKDPWGKGKVSNAEVEAAVVEAISVLRKSGAQVSEAELPDGPYEAAGGVIISVEGVAAFERLIDSGDVLQLTDPVAQVGGLANQQISGTDYLHALRLRSGLQRKMDELYRNFDVLVSLSLPTPATPLSLALDDPSLDFGDPVGGIGNLCGLPAASVPCGFSKENLPIGIQFVAPVLGESQALAAAQQFQTQTSWHRKRPSLA
jgi:aspartyl-tRNA(Asn)/glutamyl-tRNA(Gln) amidotransferase subunit A